MTADEWDRCPRSDWMLQPLHEWLLANAGLAGPFDRKLRLYAVACCRQRWDLFDEDLFRRAVDAAERLAEGRADRQELVAIQEGINDLPTLDWRSHSIENLALKLIRVEGMNCANAAAMDLGVATGWGDFESIVGAQAQILRCVFGNPFRQTAFDPVWRTSTVVNLAQTIYAERAFGQLPLLADALEFAGCNQRGVLSHCRDADSHVRGCWVIDLILEKV